MDGEDLAERVRRHYRATDKPLLLAELGVELRSAGVWPVEGDKRTLARALADSAPDLAVLSDPGTPAYVVVTPKGEEERARKAFGARRRERLLRRLPRAVVLAFCADVGEGRRVYLRKTPPHRYSADPDSSDGWWPIEPGFRSPGLFIDFNRPVGEGDAERLTQGMEAWAAQHSVDLDALAAAEAQSSARPPATVPDLPARTASNALERLCNAQPPELTARLVVPMDIALLLSRSP
jgi:hypothetical protein